MSTDLCYGLILEYVTDIPAAKTFMVDVLGLEVERDSPVFVQFKDRNGVAFAIASDESLSGTGEREALLGHRRRRNAPCNGCPRLQRSACRSIRSRSARFSG